MYQLSLYSKDQKCRTYATDLVFGLFTPGVDAELSRPALDLPIRRPDMLRAAQCEYFPKQCQ